MKRTNLIFAATLLVFATFFAACEKNDATDPMVETSQEDDQVAALYDDVTNEVDDVTMSSSPAKSSSNFETTTAGSGTRTIETSYSGDTTIRTITFVNFINGNSMNGHVKNGIIVVKILGGRLESTFERTITFQNFTIDDIKIEGEKQIVKTNDYVYSVVLTGGKVTFTDGTTYTREFTHTRTWTEGYDTPTNIWDDVFTVEGTATGVNRKGYAYTHTIVNALVIKNTCRWITEGTIDLTVNDKTATLDYGDGTCDNLGTITVNGKTTEIKLRGKR